MRNPDDEGKGLNEVVIAAIIVAATFGAGVAGVVSGCIIPCAIPGALGALIPGFIVGLIVSDIIDNGMKYDEKGLGIRWRWRRRLPRWHGFRRR